MFHLVFLYIIYPVYIFNEIVVLLTQSVNVLFVIVDTRICSNLINELIVLAKDNSITLEHVNIVRNEINKRVRTSIKINTLLVLVSLINIIGAFGNIFSGFSYNDELFVLTSRLLTLYYLKEFVFIGLVFIEVSKVSYQY
jgi:hypothetical protein